MNCYYHPDREATGNCIECGQPVCLECKVEYDGKIYCNHCIEQKITPGATDGRTAILVAPANTSGMGSNAVVPPDLGAWNWGGFLLTFIWGIGNRVWLSFLVFIPYLGAMVIPWVLAFKGNEWAWRNKRWESVEHFKRVQRIWMWWGLGLTIGITLVFVVLLIIGMAFMLWGIQRSGIIQR